MIKRGLLVFILAFSLGLSSAIIVKPKKSCAQITDCITALAEVLSFDMVISEGVKRLVKEAKKRAKDYLKKKIKSALDVQLKLDFNLAAIKATVQNYHWPKIEHILFGNVEAVKRSQERQQKIFETVSDTKFDALECSTATAVSSTPNEIRATLEVSRFTRNKTVNCINRATEECSTPAKEINHEAGDIMRMATTVNNQDDIEGGAYSDFACPAPPATMANENSFQDYVNHYLYSGILMVDAIQPNPYVGDTLGGGTDDPQICSAPLKASLFSDLWQKQAKYVINGAVGRATFPAAAFDSSSGREAFIRSEVYDTQITQLHSFKDWYFPKITPTMNNGQRLRAILRSNTGLPEPAQEALNSLDRGQPCGPMANDPDFRSHTPSNVSEYLRVKDPNFPDPANEVDAVGETTVVGCDGQDYDISSTRRSFIEHIETTYDRDQLSEKEFMNIMMSERFQGPDWAIQMNRASKSAIKRNTNNLMAFRLMQQRETHELLEYATLFAAIKVARRMGGSSRGQIAGMIQDLLPEGHKYANKEDILKATEVVSAANDNGDNPDDYIERLYQSMQ